MRQAQGMTHLKRRLVRLLAFLLAGNLFISGALAASYPYATTTNAKVNMRKSPSSVAVVLERLEDGEAVTVLGESGGYYKVSYNGRTGYIMKQYVGDGAVSSPTVNETKNEPKTDSVSGYPYQTTTKDKVNMRRSASSSAIVLERLPAGASLTVEGERGKYLKVRYNGKSGYVMAEYVNVKAIAGATAAPPSATTQANAAYALLAKGSSGKEVRALQQALIELAYLTGTVDGAYGGQTEAAVKAFQKKNSLWETGAADAAMQTLLYDGKPYNAAGKAVDVMTMPPVFGVTIRQGNMGDAVTELQDRLKTLGYFSGAVNGVCGTDTLAAVKAFQKKHGLTVDGLAGSSTQTALYSSGALPANQAPATAPPAATATPGATIAPPSITVRQGDEGEAARAVQVRLKELGYLTGEADGKFGPASAAALKAFQKKNGLDDDGVAGSATKAVLFSAAAIPALSPIVTPTPEPTAVPLTPENVIVMQRGTRGMAVLALQKRLTELGYYTAKMDSDYQAADIAAVKAFQKKNGLKVDGIAGYETQVLLYSANALPNGSVTPSPTPPPTPAPALNTLRQGDTGNEVKALQQRLIQLGYLIGVADGNFGSGTTAAVKAFQKKNELKSDGVAGAETLSRMYSTAAVAVPTPSPAPALLKQGDSNEAVKAMQATLINLGYLSGKADGVFGTQTFLALKAFQTRNSLLSDGIAGAQTLQVLVSSSAKAATPGATATPKPSGSVPAPSASQVRYANWYTEIRSRARQYPYATVYDYNTGISWKVHMFSLGAHADSEPLTAEDTANMLKAFGGKYLWEPPRPVWVIFGDGRVYMATTHDVPHGVQHRKDNNFPGHLCIHFPRTAAEVAAIGPYATAHQKAVELGWAATQNMIR